MTFRLVLIVLAGSVLSANAETFSPVLAADSIDGEFNRGAADSSPRAEQRPAPPPADHSPGGNPLWDIPLKVLSATRERPIFSPSRRPPPVIATPLAVTATAPSKPPEPERPPLLLVGTVVGEKEAIGVFLDETTKDPIRLRTGAVHQGWVLQSVHGREATFQKDQRTATLSLPQPGTDQSSASAPLAIPVSPPQSRESRHRGQ
jgi:general secretion pathway protein N